MTKFFAVILFLFSNILGATEISNREERIENEPSVQLRYIADPVSGEFKKKVYVSQAYNKKLIIAGLNLSELKDKKVLVNFNFWEGDFEGDKVSIPGSLGVPSSGIANRTGVNMLILDMKEAPFRKMSLAYDMCRPSTYPCLITSTIEIVISNDVTGKEEQRISNREVKLVIIPDYE